MFGTSAVFSVVATAVLAYLVILLLRKYLKFRQRMIILSKIPGPKPDFLFGNLRQLPGLDERGLKYIREQNAQWPTLSVGWFGPVLGTVQVTHPDTVKLVLKGSEPKSRHIYGLIKPWLGEGLLVSNGQAWARSRRLLTPAFHFDILKRYLVVQNRAADDLMSKIATYAEQRGYFEVYSNICLFSLDTILQCAFSYKSKCQTESKSNPYIQAVQDLSELMSERFFQFWLYNDFLYHLTPKGRKWKRTCDFVHSVSEKVIAERRESLDKEIEAGVETKRKDFLGILLTAKDEDGVGMTPLEIRHEVDTFMFEGHDTTTSGISWILYSIAKHPEVQHKIHEEIDEIMQGRESDDLLWDDLPKLHYTTLVIKESLRLNPPVTFIQRETTEPLTIEGYEIPVGTLINIFLYSLLNNQTVWENSQEFIPERFFHENMKDKDPYSFVPFSAGPRNCIGQHFAMNEMKTVVAKLLRRFTIELDPNHKVERLLSIVLRTKNGIRMKAVPRNPNQFWLHNDFLYHLTPKGRQWKRACDFVHNVSEKVIAERKESLEREMESGLETKCKDFLGILLTAKDEDGVGMTPLEIRNEVDTFMFEGHDTTTSGISWILYSIAKHPEIQRKIQEEVDEILQGRESDEVLWDDLPNLHYTTLVIKESLRLNPPVTFIQRETTEPLTIEGYEIPVGTLINIILYSALNNHTVWENSQEFIPERFLHKNMKDKDPYSFVTFSAGPRNCIGQHFAMNEMKTVVAKLLRRFTFELDPNHKVERLLSVVLRSKNGIRMKAVPRYPH